METAPVSLHPSVMVCGTIAFRDRRVPAQVAPQRPGPAQLKGGKPCCVGWARVNVANFEYEARDCTRLPAISATRGQSSDWRQVAQSGHEKDVAAVYAVVAKESKGDNRSQTEQEKVETRRDAVASSLAGNSNAKNEHWLTAGAIAAALGAFPHRPAPGRYMLGTSNFRSCS